MWTIQPVIILASEMSLSHFAYLRDSGPENMATDRWLLETAEQWSGPVFRRYGWNKPQFTFGYGQNAGWVEQETGKTLSQLTRRPTGGGIVAHGTDLTYCMILPRGSLGEQMAPMEFYGLLHQRWGEALAEHNISTSLMPCPQQSRSRIPGDCFKEPVGRDLMDAQGVIKLAGAAMKRTRKGVLIQGTLELAKWPDLDHIELEENFLQRIARDLDESSCAVEWPKEMVTERLSWVDIFSSLGWTRDRKSS